MRLSVIIILSLFVLVSSAQTPQELKSYLPKMQAWKITEEIEIFTPENLFERINGAAPLFIENNFREMTSMEYQKGENYITIQAYRHASPTDAFGMYTSERSEDLTFYPIGAEAQGDNMGLYFYVGSFYVKMSASEDTESNGKAMRQIAKLFAEKIDSQADYPEVFRKFPKEKSLPYTKFYTTTNYIGHEFLKGVYSCEYEDGGTTFQLFYMDGKSKEEMKTILDKYFTFTKQSLDFSEGKLLLKDKYNGNILCIWNGQYLVGIFNESGGVIPESDWLDRIQQSFFSK